MENILFLLDPNPYYINFYFNLVLQIVFQKKDFIFALFKYLFNGNILKYLRYIKINKNVEDYP